MLQEQSQAVAEPFSELRGFLGGRFIFGEAVPLAAAIDGIAGPGSSAGIASGLAASGRADVVPTLSAPITSLQPPYSLVTRAIEKDILPYAKSNNIGVIVYSPMSAGLLTGSMTRERVANFTAEDWRRNLPNFREPQLSRNLQLVEELRRIGQRQGRSPGEVAIAWTLNNPAVTGAIVGFRSPKQVEGIIGAAEFRLTPGELQEIERALQEESAD